MADVFLMRSGTEKHLAISFTLLMLTDSSYLLDGRLARHVLLLILLLI